MITLKNKEEIQTYLKFCSTHINETLAVYFKRNKALVFNIGDFILFKNHMHLYVGYFQNEKDVPTDVDCIYNLNGYVCARRCKVNNTRKWIRELIRNKNKYMKPDHDMEKYLAQKREEQRFIYMLQQNKNMPVTDRAQKRLLYRYELMDSIGGKCKICDYSDKKSLNFVITDRKQELNMSKLIRNGTKKDIEEQVKGSVLLCNKCLMNLQGK